MGFGIIICFIWLWIVYKFGIKPIIEEAKTKKLLKSLEQYADYNEEERVLYLYERNYELASALSVEGAKIATYGYEPEKYVYAGASVGGFSGGEIKKIDGYSYAAGSVKSGKYELEYAGKVVTKILLHGELAKEAKKTGIDKYIEDDYIMVHDARGLINDMSDMSALSTMILSNDLNSQAQMVDKMKPTYDKCYEILNWLCGIDNTTNMNGWVCKECGRQNPNYTGTCACGQSKDAN